jgi:RHS repeat-associated protein
LPNQYTLTPRLDGGPFGFEHAYDANGNLTMVMEYPRTADMDGNYIVDAGDLQAFQTAYMGEDPAADLNGDEVFDQADLTLFTTAFTNAPAGGFYHAALKYDERNQLIGFEARRGGTLLTKASFRYDAFNRRVASFADTDGDASDDVVTYQVYGGQAAWQLLAEYDGAGDTANLLRSYVYGLYIDEVVSMRDHASDDDYFYHQDDLFSVYALTDGDGVVVERYDYGDYGQVSIMEANGTPRAASAYGNRHAFTGRLLMPELTLDDGGQVLEHRARHLITSLGRFSQRDPMLYIDSANLYIHVISNPMRYVDPFGAACSSTSDCNGGVNHQCLNEVQGQLFQAFRSPKCRLVPRNCRNGICEWYIRCPDDPCYDRGVSTAIACCREGECANSRECLVRAIAAILACDSGSMPDDPRWEPPQREPSVNPDPSKRWWQILACAKGGPNCSEACSSSQPSIATCQAICSCLTGGPGLSWCKACCITHQDDIGDLVMATCVGASRQFPSRPRP